MINVLRQVTLISAAIILAFTTMEFLDYRRITIDTSIVVDKSRGERLTVNMNITFPRVPCYRKSESSAQVSPVRLLLLVLSLDVMDISGELQRDVSHNILKVRLDGQGKMVPNSASTELRNDVEKMSETKDANYCGSCYGGLEPESGCCNTCEEVRTAYVNRGWSFANPDAIDQASPFIFAFKSALTFFCVFSVRLRAGQTN